MVYHRNVYWKLQFDEQINNILDNNNNYKFSKHLKEQNDYRHDIDMFTLNSIIQNIRLKHFNAFECETKKNKVIKFIIRTSYGNERDISIVFLNLEKEHKVLIKTAWVNYKSDKHYTLDYSKYERR